jgi:hypothetical protein
MRRIQLYIEEDLDDRLGTQAARAGVSKASLIREAVAQRYGEAGREEDPLDSLIGSLDIAPASVDEVVYGPRAASPKAATVKRRRRRS